MTRRDEVEIHYHGLSVANLVTTSITTSDLWNGYSATASFNPLRTLNPATSTTADVARFVSTLVHDLFKK